MHYILDDAGNPQREEDTLAWARWMKDANRILVQTPTPEGMVSTVFLGTDHNYLTTYPPVLWETMVFGGPHDGSQWRYTTRQDALNGHRVTVNIVTTNSAPDARRTDRKYSVEE